MESLFRVGPWLVQPTLNSVSRGGTSIHVTPKVMEVLVCLAEHAGEPVSKEKLLQVIWPDTFVSEDVLKGSISELRRVFEDDAKEPRIIQTIAKRGYRLIAPIEPVNENARESPSLPNPAAHSTAARGKSKSWTRALFISGAALVFVLLGAFDRGGLWKRLAGQSGATQIHSLAVLPLQNLSGDPAQEYFSDGITDALITDLAQIGTVKVISRTSIMRYKKTDRSLPEIAHELNVEGIVEGTVQRSGDRVRITAQLIHGASDKHIWANSYERDTHDVFALEREVVADIAHQIQARLTTQNQTLTEQPRPVNLQALEAYLQGNYHLQRAAMGPRDKELRTAGEYFRRAIGADPSFAPAYIGLAEAHHNLWWPSNEDFDTMRTAAEKALDLAPNSSDAHRAVGMTKFEDWNWTGAEKECRRAIALNASNAAAHGQLGDFLDAMGQVDEGWREYEIAQELDPNEDHVSWALSRRGEYDRAIELLLKLADNHPDDGVVHWELAQNYAQKRMYKEWMQELGKSLTLLGFPELAGQLYRAFAKSGYAGALRQWAREGERLAASKQVYFPGTLAVVYAALGDKGRAFYWLGQGCEHRHMAISDPALVWVKVDPGFASLRSDPRFKDVLRCMGLPL